LFMTIEILNPLDIMESKRKCLYISLSTITYLHVFAWLFILKLCSLQSVLLVISKNCSFLCLCDEISFRLFIIPCVAKWTLNADRLQPKECPGMNPVDFYVLSVTSHRTQGSHDLTSHCWLMKNNRRKIREGQMCR